MAVKAQKIQAEMHKKVNRLAGKLEELIDSNIVQHSKTRPNLDISFFFYEDEIDAILPDILKGERSGFPIRGRLLDSVVNELRERYKENGWALGAYIMYRDEWGYQISPRLVFELKPKN